MGSRYAVFNYLTTDRRRPSPILWQDRPPADRDRLAGLEPPEQRPARAPEGFRAIDAEPARARLLLEEEAHARHRVDRLERAHDVFAPVNLAARRELFRAHRESRREVAEGQQLADEPLDAERAIHVEGRLASVHRHALTHPRQPQAIGAAVVG